MKIDHEIISTVILLPSADSFKKGCCQLQVKVYAQSILVNLLFKLAQEKSVVWWTDRHDMTIADDLDVKKQNRQIILALLYNILNKFKKSS